MDTVPSATVTLSELPDLVSKVGISDSSMLLPPASGLSLPSVTATTAVWKAVLTLFNKTWNFVSHLHLYYTEKKDSTVEEHEQ